jgi:uncharacterized protein (TIGR01777 family)
MQMRVLVSGSTGLVGTALCGDLTRRGNEVVRLVRGSGTGIPDAVTWDPLAEAPLRDDRLEGLDAVVHLAGENIAGRWTGAKKQRILESRVLGTQRLVEALRALRQPPAALLCASAVGYYGDTGSDVVDETASRGTGFLADVCQAWEAEALAAEQAGIRVVHMRLGVVLSPRGGALASMLRPFRIGLGGPVGNGRQLMSWITLGDTSRAVQHLLDRPDLSGAVNLVAPEPVTNRAFAGALGQALSRTARLPLPAFVVRALLGEMGSTLLLTSTGVRPGVLLDSGFSFSSPGIDEALGSMLRVDG